IDCGTALERSSQPCPACGRGLPKAKRACPDCGQSADAKDTFCSKCGSRLPAPQAPLEFDSAVEAKLRRLSKDSARELASATRASRGQRAEEGRVGTGRSVEDDGPDWIPQWLNRLNYARLVWGGLLGVLLTVVADVMRTTSDRWLVESSRLSSGLVVVHDDVKYSLAETFQNLSFFLRALGVLLAFVAVMLILLRAMRKTLVGKRDA
ncbi:MAG: Double zinc ribbon, partial [Planctomycetota bacterium]